MPIANTNPTILMLVKAFAREALDEQTEMELLDL